MPTFVTIASYMDPPLAELARAKLESEGIYCFLLGKHHIGVNWLYSNALGGVRLQVRQEDEAAARRILAGDESELLEREELDLPEPDDGDRCEKCGSADLEFVNRARLSGLLMLLNIPALFWGKFIRCRNCRHRVRIDKE